jgi:large subunit ribosomal protein L10
VITRENKEKIVARIQENLNKSEAVFLTNFVGLTSNDANRIRKDIRDANGAVIIARNKLLQKAAEGTRSSEVFCNLKGPHAIAFAFKDAPAVAKVLYDAKKSFEMMTLEGGVLNGRVLTSKDVEALASLPSRDQMLATLLATFNAPVSAFVRVLDQIRQKKELGE